MVDHRVITGPEFIIIDGVVGDGVQSDSGYFIGRDTPQSPLRWGVPNTTTGIGITRLKDHGLAHTDGKWLVIERPACIELRNKIVGDLHCGLMGSLLKKLVIRAGEKPGEMIDPDGIYGELGIGNRAYILTKTLIDRGLVSQHPQYQKPSGVKYALVVSDEAKKLVTTKRVWKRYLFGAIGWVFNHPIPTTLIAVILAGFLARLLYVKFGWNLFDPSTWKG